MTYYLHCRLFLNPLILTSLLFPHDSGCFRMLHPKNWNYFVYLSTDWHNVPASASCNFDYSLKSS
jgi:hypothetical protein